MSDAPPPPPKPKPGSLRDRIAAFEKPKTAGSAPAPPPLRPKPAGTVSWKPKPPSPPSDAAGFSPGSAASEEGASAGAKGGMSASDAKESIGRGGSLKERMAALQGRGAFGGAAPAPAPPVGTGKKWVPPPKPERVEEDVAVVAVPDREDGEANKAQGETEDKQEEQAEEGEKDPEEEERQRRAAIAARMARLGGARVGMSPPVFGPKPTIKKRPSEDAASVKSTGSEGTPASPPTSPPIPAASLASPPLTKPASGDTDEISADHTPGAAAANDDNAAGSLSSPSFLSGSLSSSSCLSFFLFFWVGLRVLLRMDASRGECSSFSGKSLGVPGGTGGRQGGGG
ncbi:hypothetical protein B0H11DRAFT_241731 [Mycena galericulata]|nr:hypothetical protein B0H11DRAFT_241731 [Mycena galericulata]